MRLSKDKKFALLAAGTVLLAKFMLLAFVYQAFQIITDDTGIGPLEMWKRWDAVSYMRIADLGYRGEGEYRFLIVFFPLYPVLVAGLESILGDHLVSGFIISGLASVGLALVFRKLVLLDHSERIAQTAVIFLFIFPTSYFLHIPYTESLFLFLAVSCFLAVRKRSWLVAAVVGLLASMTRINGVVLIPCVAFEIYAEYRETKALNYRWIAALSAPGIGFGLYLLLNYVVTGSFTTFLAHQQEHWGKFFRFPLAGVGGLVYIARNSPPTDAHMRGIEELLFIGIGLAATIACFIFLRKSYAVWMAGNWLISVSTSYLLSVPRYTLLLFPLFILMAMAAMKSQMLRILFVGWSVFFLAVFSFQFARGWWAF